MAINGLQELRAIQAFAVKLLVLSALSSGIAWFPHQSAALGQTCNPFGCPNPGAGECNSFGCPNPGARACTPFSCPASPPRAASNPNDAKRSFTVHNNTGTNITGLYISSSGAGDWCPNDLDNMLYNGNSFRYSLTGSCQWDLRARLADGNELTQRNIDTCINTSYTLGATATQKPMNNPVSGGSSFGECMDRVMYQDFRANSEPDSDSWYTFDLPSSLTSDQIKQAGFRSTYFGKQHKQSVVRVQVKTAEQAAPVCR
ncbi:hypothetical protein H6F76_04420 [Leptolyngbya sp. FACHB-321]|uniref:hypothetical protein n=1 Tax=Leptolyngbya sp. FACHB-321 TaxID=2692807 RepID=UPI001689923B|nr:hypothetical protein [Leptolyngbya sp. FACHB-321]MBD2034285.1 hypothetical protein [Leptolyngbya sp. FACHB-321]